MAPDLKAVTFRLEREILEGLQRIKERDGIPATEQVRRALYAWLDVREPSKKTGRKRAVTRKRP